MAWKSAGRSILRWVLWTLAAWVMIRGIVSLMPETAPSATNPVSIRSGTISTEPPGVRTIPAMFAREYLSWQPGGAEDRAARLQPYLIQDFDRHAGLTLGRSEIGQQVQSVEVYSVRQIEAERWHVTVAAHVIPFTEVTSVSPSGNETKERRSLAQSVLRLTVPVIQIAGGGWAIYEYPSIAPMPRAGQVLIPPLGPETAPDRDEQVKGLLAGFFRAYLDGNQADTSYFTAPGARLPAPPLGFSFDSIGHYGVYITGSGHLVAAVIRSVDNVTGARFTSHYTLQLAGREGRWYVQEILSKGDH